MAATGLHISISAEEVFSLGGLSISNSMLTSLIVSGLIVAFSLAVKSSIKTSGKPSGLQNFAEMLVEGLLSFATGVTGSSERAAKFFPLFASFFIFILLNNWAGLLPGVGTIGFMHAETEEHAQVEVESVHNEVLAAEGTLDIPDPEALPTVPGDTPAEVAEDAPHETFVPYFRAGTADLNTTLALAIISVIATQVFGVMYLKLPYFSKYFNFKGPIEFFVGILELVLELAKVVSFAFRLFGNIFAGEVLLAVISFLVPLIVPMPFYGLEVVVGVIQALVFAMLSLVFFNMATISHEEH
jgi:F-type H+-transporting ATPase subunit a